MSRTSAWVIAEQERDYQRWLDERERLDAETFGVFIPETDPESIPNHDYATEAEARAHLEETTVPAVAVQNTPTEVP